jgi:hypothetical protein
MTIEKPSESQVDSVQSQQTPEVPSSVELPADAQLLMKLQEAKFESYEAMAKDPETSEEALAILISDYFDPQTRFSAATNPSISHETIIKFLSKPIVDTNQHRDAYLRTPGHQEYYLDSLSNKNISNYYLFQLAFGDFPSSNEAKIVLLKRLNEI